MYNFLWCVKGENESFKILTVSKLEGLKCCRHKFTTVLLQYPYFCFQNQGTNILVNAENKCFMIQVRVASPDMFKEAESRGKLCIWANMAVAGAPDAIRVLKDNQEHFTCEKQQAGPLWYAQKNSGVLLRRSLPALIRALQLEAAVHRLRPPVVLVYQFQFAVTQRHSLIVVPVHESGWRWGTF